MVIGVAVKTPVLKEITVISRIRLVIAVATIMSAPILFGSNASAQQPYGPAVFEQKLIAGDAADEDSFGFPVVIEGDTAVVGAYLADHSGFTDAGAAYVYTRSAGVWTQEDKLIALPGDLEDDLRFGFSVDISGDTVVVGAYHYQNSTGVAYVYVRSGGAWSFQQRLTASDPNPSDNFGFASAIDGDSIIIGAYDSSGSGEGSAFVFTRSGAVWSEQQQLSSPDPSPTHRFGFAVDIDGDTVVVGDHVHPPDGAAYVFTRTAGVWSLEQPLAPTDLDAESFGFPLVVDGDTIIVTDRLGDVDTIVDAGAAYVYTRSGSVWTEVQRLTASDPGQEAQFGRGIDIDGGTTLVSAPQADHSGLIDAGSAYVFRQSGGVWTEVAQLRADDAATEDGFGVWTTMDAGSAVIGAYEADHSGFTDTGAAYVYLVDNIFIFADGFESGDTDEWNSVAP